MRIIKAEEPSFTQKKFTVELSVAEIAALAACIGEYNSSDVSQMVKTDYRNEALTNATTGLGDKLFDVLDEIVRGELK